MGTVQQQRFEYKYQIREEVALAVRDFVRGYLDVDEFGAAQPNFSYPVHSTYLDSDDLYLHQTTVNGDKNRFKLRLRYYSDSPDEPIYFEIKRKMNNIVFKQRGGVKRNAVRLLLDGHLPAPEHLVSQDPRDLVAIQEFCKQMNRLGAKPKAHVAYMREAWISRFNNAVRVTMDRAVQCEPELEMRLATKMDRPVNVFSDVVTLELKFADRFPDWFRDLTRVFGLVQCGAAKYVEGVNLSGRHLYATERPAQTEAPVESPGLPGFRLAYGAGAL